MENEFGIWWMSKRIFIMEMKMDKLMGSEFEKRFDYNEWMMGYKN